MISVEIKARCSDPARVRFFLKSRRAVFKGLDHQVDTYFRVPSGRLKLREGNIESALIYYKRTDQKNSKRCDSLLWELDEFQRRASKESLSPKQALKRILASACGIFTVVDKNREIYFIQNVKFHIDNVKKLGRFVEIEVFGKKRDASKLRKQCESYQKLLGIRPKDLVADSYSDQIFRKSRRA